MYVMNEFQKRSRVVFHPSVFSTSASILLILNIYYSVLRSVVKMAYLSFTEETRLGWGG